MLISELDIMEEMGGSLAAIHSEDRVDDSLHNGCEFGVFAERIDTYSIILRTNAV